MSLPSPALSPSVQGGDVGDNPATRAPAGQDRLGSLTADAATSAVLVQKGYTSVAAIAAAPRADFLRATGEELGEARAARLHGAAQAQGGFLDAVLVGLAADAAGGIAPADGPLAAAASATGGACRDCAAAVSPQAYLADLLSYALKHVRSSPAAGGAAAGAAAVEAPAPVHAAEPAGLAVGAEPLPTSGGGGGPFPEPTPLPMPTIRPPGGVYDTGAVAVTMDVTEAGATIHYELDGSEPTADSAQYVGPFTLTMPTTVKALASAFGREESAVAAETYFISAPPGTVRAPTISPNGGAFVDSVTVTLTCVTAGATIRYTLDGSDPTAASPLYAQPFSLASTGTTLSATVKARGFLDGLADSPIALATFRVAPPPVLPPTIAPPGGTFTGSVTVTLAAPQTSAQIRYTLDGSDPTMSSTQYGGPFVLTGSAALKVRAFRYVSYRWVSSSLVQAAFTILPPPQTVATPTLDPAGGVHTRSVTVELRCATPGAQIRYTLDDSEPTAGAGLYTAPFTLTSGAIVRARAFKEGMLDSAVAAASFVINGDVGAGAGTGLKGEYFDDVDFTSLKLTREDARVDFEWGTGSPDPGLGPDLFSVRWTGQVQPRYSESYTFYTVSDDGVRLWVDGQLLVDNWTIHEPIENSGTIRLAAGRKYDLKLEYFESGGNATARLLWSSLSQPKEVIASTQLYSSFGPRIDLRFLAEALHQHFADLPASREALDQPVRHVRLGIEALRGYLARKVLPAPGSTQEAALAREETDYRLAAYGALLARLGTSYEELRLARTADAMPRRALAERLGIDLAPARPDQLDALFLDPGAPAGQLGALAEAALDALFDLADTTRPPLSQGLTLDDPLGQVTRWNLAGVELGRNTDADGLVYAALTLLPDATVRVDLFRDLSRTSLVASGQAATPLLAGSKESLGGTQPRAIDLTAEGALDWAHWGLANASSFDHKTTGLGQITTYSVIGRATPVRYASDAVTYSWSDGTPTASTAPTPTGVYVEGVGNGFTFSVPADTTARTLRVYVGVWKCRGQLRARLGDASVPAYLDATIGNPAGYDNVVYTLRYRAASDGQRLTVEWTMLTDLGGGNVTLQAATLLAAVPATDAPPLGQVAVAERNGSGLSGDLAIAFRADAAGIKLSAIPRFLAWRLRHLRTLWDEQDWPADAYAQAAPMPGRARRNVAAAANGATASASSTYDGDCPPGAAINGDRRGAVFPGMWTDDTPGEFPDWLEITFAGPKSIDEIDVFLPQDGALDGTAAPVEPTPDMTFARYGITAFDVQYWTGAAWVTVPGGSVTNNRKVWWQVRFPAVTTDRVRVRVHDAAPAHAATRHSRIVEVEAYQAGTRTNVALAANGGTARASSTMRPWPPRMVIDGDRIVYHWKGQTPFTYPGWLQVDFAGSKTIDEIDVYFHQDTAQPTVWEPTETLTSPFALRDFDVQCWSGSSWATVPGGSVVGNDRVWRRFTFAPLRTDKIRLLVRGNTPGVGVAVQEVEAYTGLGGRRADGTLPLVDPDLVGPDDFRLPLAKPDSGDPDRAFDLWLRRRTWVEGRLAALAALRKTVQIGGQPVQVPDLGAMLAAMTQPVAYDATSVVPWPNMTAAALEDLYERLAAGDDVAATRKRIEDLGLTADALVRLMGIRARDSLADGTTDAERVQAEEWREVYSILAQAQKWRLFPAWRAEEQRLGLLLGPAEFWPALREPPEGDWPPVVPAQTPLIDPEVVAPDDLPEPTAGRRARALWRARRSRLDQIARALKGAGSLDAKLRLALGDPLPHDLAQLLADLNSSDPAVAEEARRKITRDLHLSVAGFTRLMMAKAKVDAGRSPAAGEWTDIHAQLTSAQKVRQEYPAWLAAEQDAAAGVPYWAARKARLPRWRATVEARQAWLQALRARSRPPLIEPDLIGPADLKVPLAGEPAFDLWQERKTWVEDRLVALEVTREGAATPLTGLDAILVDGLFGPAVLAGAHARLQTMREAHGLASILADALGDPLPDLDGLLAALAGGTDPAGARRTITHTLGLTVEAFQRLMQLRARDAAGNPPLTADEWNEVYASLARATLVASVATLPEQRTQGLDLTGRLDQFGLDRGAYVRLMQLRDLVSAGQPVLDAEWGDAYAILTQVSKGRQAAVWRQQEWALGRLAVGPDHFRIPAADPAALPPPSVPEPPAWRGTWQARHDWQETLRSRLAQDEAAVAGLRDAVGAAEEATLTGLRDALASSSDAPGSSAEARATWLGDRLLLDLRTGGRQTTTRIAQAIESVQGLLFALRSGRLRDTYPSLSLDDEDFDGTWEWLGSYATWRAAMFVFLYPENVLLPSLRKWQTPAFRQLVADLRTGRRLTAQQARDAARAYLDYLRDIVELIPVAACQTRTRRQPGGDYRYVCYLFARAASTSVYWSAYDPEGTSGYDQTPWAPVPGLGKQARVIAAVPYAIGPNQRYIYLFANVPEQNSTKLVFTRYNLETEAWTGETAEIELPDDVSRTAQVVVSQTLDESQPPHLGVSSSTREVLYHQRFNRDGTSGRWAVLARPGATDASGPSGFTLQAMVDFAPGKCYALGWGPSLGGGELFYALFDGDVNQYWRTLGPAFFGRVELAFAWPGTLDVYVFFTSFTSRVYRAILSTGDPSPAFTTPAGLVNVVPSSGAFPADRPRQVFAQSVGSQYQYGPWRCNAARQGDHSLTWGTPARVAPRLTPAFDLTDRLAGGQLTERWALTRAMFEANAGGSRANLAYLEEAFYFVPVHLALQLQQRGEYTAALDWLRTVYDHSRPAGRRKIYYGLELEESYSAAYQRAADWLLDPLNPHAIAASRVDAYTRFTLLSLVRCFLDYADAEFTRDTAESVARARALYATALELLESPELRQGLGAGDSIGAIDIQAGDPHLALAVAQIKQELRQLADGAAVEQAAAQVSVAMAGDGAWTSRIARAWEAVAAARAAAAQPPPPRLAALVAGDGGVGPAAQASLLSHAPVAQAAEWLRALADASAVAPRASSVGAAAFRFRIPPNPFLAALRARGELNLHKLRHGRNIAGLERALEPYASPTDAASGLPALGAGGALVLPGARMLRPTPYRYAAVVERAKHLVGLSQQVETAFLTALERRDAEYVSLLKARQDLRLAQAGVRLQDLRREEANDARRLAELERDRARLQLDHYDKLLTDELMWQETLALVAMWTAVAFQAGAAAASFTAAGWAIPGAGEEQRWSAVASGLSSLAGAASTTASALSTIASYERRRQEWEFQKSLAQQDLLIGDQGVTLADDRLRIVGQEQRMSVMQAEHAEAIAEFLATKFTNVELYDWMSGVLERVYSFFLQQATAVAQLAASELAFERQEMPPPFIQADYWETPNEGAMGSTDGSAPDRRGLTGSARLLQDLYQLDQYAFETNRRKLQLAKTLSLARLAPAEFQRFRETGVLTFATPLALFDRDFPGHYLRLVSRVRTSVVALIPPNQGIHATLSVGGTSRAVVGGDVFQTVVLRRGPESVALTSPLNASGLFELDPQPEMLRPFEGRGVDATWELRLPRAANLFDYRTLADVLVTIEYTALDSVDYRRQVAGRLDRRFSADRPFSFRHQFADQWYDLHNPDRSSTPLVVRFRTGRDDFPPNIDDLRIQHLVLYFARASGEAFEVPVTHLRFSEQGRSAQVGGGATSVNGAISTRSGNAGNWLAMLGKRPVGEWELALPDTPEVREMFSREAIEDVLFVISYGGQTPDWPS